MKVYRLYLASLPTWIRCSAFCLLSIVLTAFLSGCGRPAEANGGQGASSDNGSKQAEASAIAVKVTPAILGDIDKTVEVTGSLVALEDVVVGNKLAGKLAAVYVHEGDKVQAGQVVAQMDDVDLKAQVMQQQANLQSALTKEQQAMAQLKQARNALRIAQTTLEWIEKTTASAVQSAQKALQSAEEQLAIIKQGARTQERKQAEEQVRAAKANYDKARADLKRYQALYREQAISQSQLDQAQAACDAAEASYNSAREALSLIQEGARPEELRQAQLAVDAARVALQKAQADRDQVRLRQEDVLNARTGIEVAEANLRTQQAGVQQARAALRIAQDNLTKASIRSPIDGYVAKRLAEPGQQLGGGGSVMRIVSPNSIYFQAILSESEFAEVRLGQSVSITVDALPTKTPFWGKVTRILPVASSAARSFTVRVDFERKDPRFRPEMFARGRILIDTHQNTTLVPKDAVLFDPLNNQARLFVAPNGRAEERRVQVGYMNPQYVEILSGVKPGEKVIVAGQNALQNGDWITVK
jgi:HlyD family secretion protein